MAIDKDMLDQLLAGREPQVLFAKDGLLDELKKALLERMLSAELDDHLENEGTGPQATEGQRATNRRNGSSRKTMLTGTSKVTLDIPRDRAGTFAPKLIARYQRRFPDFDEKIVSMYARGMTVREIRGHLDQLYGIDVSPDLISTITNAVLEAVAEWQGCPLDARYPLVFFDAIRVKIRDEGFVRNKAVYIALGILPDGTKEILGIWIEQTEGAKFWLRVMNELKNRGVADILIADSHAPLTIKPNWLSTDEARKAMIELLRYVRRYVAQPALAPFIAEEMTPGSNVESDDETLEMAFRMAPWDPCGAQLPDGQRCWIRSGRTAARARR